MQITSGKATLSAESHGTGEPTVLLIHAGVTDQRSWSHVVDRLPDHRCLTYDTRGYGRTTYEPEDGWSYVGDALAVLDAHDVDAAVLVGASNGGRTAIDLTLAHPDRVRGLALIGPAISGAPDQEVEDAVKPLERALDAAEEAGDLEEVNRLEAHLWLDGPLADEGRVAGPVRDLFLEMNAQALAAPDPGERTAAVPAWHRLEAIDVPTLVLVGALDLREIRDGCEHAARDIPGARLVVVPDVAHLPHLEGDPATLEEITAFVAGL